MATETDPSSLQESLGPGSHAEVAPATANIRTEQAPSPASGLSARASQIRAMFSTIAPTYDRLNHVLSFSIDRLWRHHTVRRTLALAEPTRRADRPWRVLDVCAGTGDLSLAFARRLSQVGGGRVVALDYSHAMLTQIASKSRAAHVEPSLPVEADALRLPLADGGFDLATVAFGLRNLVDRPAGLREMARVVRPGGVVAVLEFSRPRNRLLRALYGFYLSRLLPAVGNRWSRSRAYTYLADTIEAFPSPEEVLDWMRQANLEHIEAEPLTGGIAFLYTGVIPCRSNE
ncbi:MAG TPA: ubiquinone/menaquinone biosynthesis methyltransferase [Candidatus Sumerlaeota bacterium]|nr:ubiquinone/menaquinone biosynthesis methyltransferase [Candidatus Sumerlaeota bacterium]